MDSLDAQLAAAQEQANKLLKRTALLNACSDLDVDAALELIATEEDLATADKAGRTPLHEAARYAHLDEAKALLIVTALLDAGVPIDPVEKGNKQTPMIEAAIYVAPRVLQLLIERGANVNHKMKDGNTTLGAITATTAMMRGRAKIIKILEAAGGVGRKR